MQLLGGEAEPAPGGRAVAGRVRPAPPRAVRRRPAVATSAWTSSRSGSTTSRARSSGCARRSSLSATTSARVELARGTRRACRGRAAGRVGATVRGLGRERALVGRARRRPARVRQARGRRRPRRVPARGASLLRRGARRRSCRSSSGSTTTGGGPCSCSRTCAHAEWPPPWDDAPRGCGARDAARGARDAAAGPSPAAGRADRVARDGWAEVAGRAGAVPLGRPRRSRLARALAARARGGLARRGARRRRVCHLDVRSDNLCFSRRPRGARRLELAVARRTPTSTRGVAAEPGGRGRAAPLGGAARQRRGSPRSSPASGPPSSACRRRRPRRTVRVAAARAARRRARLDRPRALAAAG